MEKRADPIVSGLMKAAPAVGRWAGILNNPTVKTVMEAAKNPNVRAGYGALFGGGAGLAHGLASGDDFRTTMLKALGGAAGTATALGLGNERYKALLPYAKPLGIGAGVIGAGALGGSLLAGGGGGGQGIVAQRPQPKYDYVGRRTGVPPWAKGGPEPMQFGIPGINPAIFG